MDPKLNDNFNVCNALILLLVKYLIPCLQNAVDDWHKKQTIKTCSSPSQCPKNKKPSGLCQQQAKKASCQQCIDWATAIEQQVYPHTPQNMKSLKWMNVDPTLFGQNPVELLKLFALRMKDTTVAALADFDPAPLLQIMSKFKPFHFGKQSVVDKLKKVVEIRNDLAHRKVNSGLELSDQHFAAYWKDINDLVDEIEKLGWQSFDRKRADELRQKMDETVANAPSNPEKQAKDLAKSVAADLKKYYLNSYCKKQIYPWKQGTYLDLDDIYVPVTIDIEIPDGMRAIKQRLKEYQEIFDSDKDTRYILTGDPGQGKSTFCAKLAFDWCHNCLSSTKNIELLFIIHLARVDHTSNIENAICSQLLSSFNCDRDKLYEAIRFFGDQVVIVLDGLDEAPLDLLTHQNTGNLVEVLRYTQFRESCVLVTTRPWRENDVLQGIPGYRRLELQKMRRAEVKAHIKKLFGQNHEMIALRRRLLQYIDGNELLLDCSSPLMVLLISWFWAETKGKRRIPDRKSEVYEEIVSIMYESFKQSTANAALQPNNTVESNPDERFPHNTYAYWIYAALKSFFKGDDVSSLTMERLYSLLGELSLIGLTPSTTKIVFTDDEIRQSCGRQNGLDQLRRMGLLCDKGPKGTTSLQFFHKSGQEHCAGQYLQNNLERAQSYMKCVTSIDDALRVAPVLIFASRSHTTAKVILTTLLKIFKAEVVPSTYYKEGLSPDDFLRIQQYIELCLDCNFEAEADSMFVSILRDLFADGKVLFYGISSKTALALAYFLQSYRQQDPKVARKSIHNITLRPVPHVTDSRKTIGISAEIFDNALKGFTDSPRDLDKIKDKFVESNPDLHENWKSEFPASHLAAYIPCIQAFEELPPSWETNIKPIIQRFGDFELKTLDLNHFKLEHNFTEFLRSIDEDKLACIRTLNACFTTKDYQDFSAEQQITKLVSLLNKLPLLRSLLIAHNKAEPGQTIPILADKLNQCKELKELDAKFMYAPAKDMEVLAKNIPSHLTGLSIVNNEMSDIVTTHLIDTLPQALEWLAVSLDNLSEPKHDEFLQTMHSKYKLLQKVTLWMSPYPSDLVKHGGLMLASCKDLTRLTMKSSCTEFPVIPGDSVKAFTDGLAQAWNIKNLSLYDIRLDKMGFDRVLELSRPKGLNKLEYARKLLPGGVNADNLPDFMILN